MRLALLILFFLIPAAAFGQDRVANYETGKLGTKSYERFSFWVKDGMPSEVTYGFGRDWYDKEIKPTYAGPVAIKGARGFKLQFPNGQLFYVIPQGRVLRITDSSGKYTKIFRWSYEGPVNGRGTYCDPCTQDPKEAIELIRSSYLK
jgi:hypothetical protein